MPGRLACLSLLKASASLPSPRLASSLHAYIRKSGSLFDVFISTALVTAVSQCSDVDTARALFDDMPERDGAAWNAMLTGYARHGCTEAELSLFRCMVSSGVVPNHLTLSVVLQACRSVRDERLGRCIHAYILRRHGVADTFLYNSLLVYYNEFGDVRMSELLFEWIPRRDVVSWNVLMSGYLHNGFPGRVMDAFHSLRAKGFSQDVVTLETALQACAQMGEDATDSGESTHALLVKLGVPADVYVENSLLLMYCKCGNMDCGQSLFDKMEVRNIVSWNILIDGYVRVKLPKKALELIAWMRFHRMELSSHVLISALQALKLMQCDAKHVMTLHCLIIVLGFDSDMCIATSLISAYGETGLIEFARQYLDYVCCEEVGAIFCWNSLLSACVRCGFFSEAVDLVYCMQVKHLNLDAATLVNALSLCTQQQELKLGKGIHGYIIRKGFDSDVFVSTSLLELYLKCGLLNAACSLFSKMHHRNLVSWNTMIHGCLQNGFPVLSLKLFHDMKEEGEWTPDVRTIVGVIKAIALRGYKQEANYIHEYAIRSGLLDVDFVANSLISMHARSCDFDKAGLVFDRSRKLSTVTWNIMIAEYSHHGQFDRAISIFYLMKMNNVKPDSITFLCLLKSCAGLCSLHSVMWIHSIIYRCGHVYDVFLATSLIDVYAKCGDLGMARLLFDNMGSKTIITWNSMILAYGMHGISVEASKLFSQVLLSGLNPTIVTFLILISVCSHSGDVEKGRHYFNLMTQTYSFSPRKEHLSSFIDLLGRRGLVEEAYESLKTMPMDPGACAWGSLVQACRVHGNFKLGLSAAEKLFELDPLHCGYYALYSNMFADAERWIDASTVRRKIETMDLKKMLGWSMVDSHL